MSPVYVPVLILVFSLAKQVADYLKHRFSWHSADVALVCCLTLSLIYPGGRALCDSYARFVGGAGGYSTPKWRESAVIRYLVRHQGELKRAEVFSNEPEAIYIVSNLEAKYGPLKRYYGSSDPALSLTKLRGVWPAGDEAYLIWFDRSERDFVFSIDELRTIASIKQIAHMEDGSVFRVNRMTRKPPRAVTERQRR